MTAAGRFAAQATALREHLAALHAVGALAALDPGAGRGWPAGRRLVLGADAALDLGSPAVGSVAFLLWSNPGDAPGPGGPGPGDHRLFRHGPDLTALAAASRQAPLGLALHVVVGLEAAPEREYERYLDLKEALYAIALEGVTLRSMPSQQHLWLRVHRDAVQGGLSLAHLGAAMADALGAVPDVANVEILFVTAGRDALAPLHPLAEAVHRRVGALVKRNEEPGAECDACEFRDVCDEREHVP